MDTAIIMDIMRDSGRVIMREAAPAEPTVLVDIVPG